MMLISVEKLEEYREIYKRIYGEEISKEDALIEATALLNMLEVLTRPEENDSLYSL